MVFIKFSVNILKEMLFHHENYWSLKEIKKSYNRLGKSKVSNSQYNRKVYTNTNPLSICLLTASLYDTLS